MRQSQSDGALDRLAEHERTRFTGERDRNDEDDREDDRERDHDADEKWREHVPQDEQERARQDGQPFRNLAADMHAATDDGQRADILFDALCVLVEDVPDGALNARYGPSTGAALNDLISAFMATQPHEDADADAATDGAPDATADMDERREA